MLEERVQIVIDKPLALTGQIEQGKNFKFSEEEVMTFKDLPTESYELGAILQHNTTYELIDFLVRLQGATASHMAQEHAKQQMVERVLVNELKSEDEPKLQKAGRRPVTKKCGSITHRATQAQHGVGRGLPRVGKSDPLS